MKVHLPGSVKSKLQEISIKYFPKEACALLVGEKGNEKIKIQEAREAENVLKSGTAFQIDPELVVETLDELEKKKKRLVGFFHSHPKLSVFVSPRDEKFMKLWLDKVWLIAGTNDQGEITKIRAFRWTDEDYEEIEIKSD